jgi:type IV pilus assembly protein PilQ
MPNTTRTSIWLIVLFTVSLCTSSGRAAQPESHHKTGMNPAADGRITHKGLQAQEATQQDALRYARHLFKEHRYREAASLLKLQRLSENAASTGFEYFELLIRSQMACGDYPAAQESLNQAMLRPLPARQQRTLARLNRSLVAVLPSLDAGKTLADSVKSAVDSIPEESSKLISNSFFETDLRQVLTDLSNASGVPIVWDPTVEGSITYDAKDLPLEAVLNAILLPQGYAYRMDHGTCFVGSSNPKNSGFALISSTAVIPLANVDATEAIQMLSDYFEPYVKAVKSTNTVCITAPATILERIRADVLELDKPPAQILIDVAVCEFSEDALRSMGLNWAVSRTEGRNPSWDFGVGATDISDAAVGGSYTEMQKKIGHYTADLTASIEALEATGDAQIRANPRIITMNGRMAEISLTKDQYFVIQTGSGQYQYNTLQSVSSGIKLQITPFLNPSGNITLILKPEVGDVVGQGLQGLPEINKRAASTSVMVKDGETFTVGGLNIQREKNVRRGVPFLASIPILGYLFRYDEREVKDTEIIIFVTPHLLNR